MKNAPLGKVKDFGTSPSGDMSRVKSSANGSGKQEMIGSSSKPAEPGHAASGEMNGVKRVASICPTGTNKDR